MMITTMPVMVVGCGENDNGIRRSKKRGWLEIFFLSI